MTLLQSCCNITFLKEYKRTSTLHRLCPPLLISFTNYWLFMKLLVISVTVYETLNKNISKIYLINSSWYKWEILSNHRKGLKSVAALLPLLGVTWIFGLLVNIHEALDYIFILLTSTQVCFTSYMSRIENFIKGEKISKLSQTAIFSLKQEFIGSWSTRPF